MENEKGTPDKPDKKPEAPPRVNDPELSATVKFTDKPAKKTIVNIKREEQ